jgi:hypothetical protein
MTAKWRSTCTCCGGQVGICDAVIPPAAGGDEGFCQDYTVSSSDVGNLLRFIFEPFFQRDRLVVLKNPGAACIPGNHSANISTGTIVVDTGCVGSGNPVSNPYDYIIEPGVTSLRIVVVPNCAGGSGTAWNLTVTCYPCPDASYYVGFLNDTAEVAVDITGYGPLGTWQAAVGSIWVFELDIPNGWFTDAVIDIRLRQNNSGGAIIAETSCNFTAAPPARLAVWESAFAGNVYVEWRWVITIAPFGEGDLELTSRCGAQIDVDNADCPIF